MSIDKVIVGELMTRDVLCVRPELPASVALARIEARGLQAAPVVAFGETVIGFVTRADLGMRRAIVVRDVMTPALVVGEDGAIESAAHAMAAARAHQAAVVDREGRLVGVLSALDVLRWLGAQPAAGHPLG